MRSFRLRLALISVVVLALACGVIYLAHPGFEAGSYEVPRWRLLVTTSNTERALHLEALEHIAAREGDTDTLNAFWRAQVRTCCAADARRYSKFLATQKLTHAQFVRLVRTYHYFRTLDDKQWAGVRDEYGDDVEQWWREQEPMLARRAANATL